MGSVRLWHALEAVAGAIESRYTGPNATGVICDPRHKEGGPWRGVTAPVSVLCHGYIACRLSPDGPRMIRLHRQPAKSANGQSQPDSPNFPRRDGKKVWMYTPRPSTSPGVTSRANICFGEVYPPCEQTQQGVPCLSNDVCSTWRSGSVPGTATQEPETGSCRCWKLNEGRTMHVRSRPSQ